MVKIIFLTYLKKKVTYRYPSYKKLCIAKTECYPSNMIENEALVSLQSLLDHTMTRFIQTLNRQEDYLNLVAYYKWGFDGSSGHTIYKQIQDTNTNSDASVIITTMVPLRILNAIDCSVVWENTSPSSTRYV